MTGGRVLLATGDDALLAALRDTLAAEGILVERHLELGTLVQQAASTNPHVVVLGAEALAHQPGALVPSIKELCGRHTRVLALLDRGDEAQCRDAVAAGVDDFVVPPLRVVELRSRVRAGVAHSLSLADASAQRRDAAALQELAQTLTSGLPAHDVLHAASRLAASVLAMDRCAVVIIDAERNKGTLAAVSEDRHARDISVELPRYPELLKLMDTGAPVFVADAATDPLMAQVREASPTPPRGTLLLFPVMAVDKVVGAFFLRSRALRPPPTERELLFGSTVALTVGAVLRSPRPHASRSAAASRPPSTLQRFEELFEDAPDGIVILDDSSCVAYANREGAGLFGVAPRDMLGHEFTAFLSSDSVPVLRSVLADVRNERFRKNFDLCAVQEDGDERCLSCSAGAVGDGERRACMISFRDVTQLREMQNELRATKEFLENLVDSSVDAIMAADVRGNVILFNKGAEKLFGYRADEVLGKMRLSRLYPAGGAREIMDYLRSDAHGGRGRLEAIRKSIRNHAGEEVPVSLTASIIYENGEEVATVGIFNDLRERLHMESTLTQTQQRLLETEKAAVVAQLAGTAAHELNQPLTSVLGYAEMLKGRVPEDSPLRRPVDIIFREGERMADIVKKIGRITRYETKNYMGNVMIVDLERSSSEPKPAEPQIPEPTPRMPGRKGPP